MKEIVGARIGTLITNHPKTIREAIEQGVRVEWLDRQKMQFMSGAGLGSNWDNMASGVTIFCMDEDGRPHDPDTLTTRGDV